MKRRQVAMPDKKEESRKYEANSGLDVTGEIHWETAVMFVTFIIPLTFLSCCFPINLSVIPVIYFEPGKCLTAHMFEFYRESQSCPYHS